MSKQTRTRVGVFETNSSSTHSVTVHPLKDGEHKDSSVEKYVDFAFAGGVGQTVLYVYPGEFGWEFEEYSDFPSKLAYAYTFAKSICKADDNKALNMLRKVLLESEHIDCVVFCRSNDDYYEYGYIDHQSYDVAQSLFDSEEKLRNFLFNPNSFFETGNDNV